MPPSYDAGGVRSSLYYARLSKSVVADLLDIFLRHDPAGACRARIEGQEVRPRLLEPEADPSRVGSLDAGDPVSEHLVRVAAVSLERKLDVLDADKVAVVELDAFAEDELVHQPVRRCAP